MNVFNFSGWFWLAGYLLVMGGRNGENIIPFKLKQAGKHAVAVMNEWLVG